MASPLYFLVLSTTIIITAAGYGILLPIRKDPKTSQIYTTFQMGTPRTDMNAVIDLGGRHLWFACDNYTSNSYAPVICDSPQCKLAGSGGCFSCHGPTRPGCTAHTCAGHISINPYLNDYDNDGYYQDTLLSKNRVELTNFIFSCVPDYFRGGLAAAAAGVLGLGMNPLAIHKQAADKFNLRDEFWICPASSGSGKLSIGLGLPSTSKIEMKSTKLIVNPNSTLLVYRSGEASEEYFIRVKSIKVGGEPLAVEDSYFSFGKDGVGGTKLSTVQYYTSLHTSIYEQLVHAFDKKAAAHLMMKSVPAVAPFKACYSSESVKRTAAGPVVPEIDLVLAEPGVYWRINGPNSMVEIDQKTMCLAFVDAGSKPKTSVVIGVHQLEDNLLEFDVTSMQLKFSSSLLLQNKSCSRL